MSLARKVTALCRATIRYNANRVDRGDYYSVQSSGSPCGTGVYRSKGLTYAYTGGGYNSYSTYASPYQNYPD